MCLYDVSSRWRLDGQYGLGRRQWSILLAVTHNDIVEREDEDERVDQLGSARRLYVLDSLVLSI